MMASLPSPTICQTAEQHPVADFIAARVVSRALPLAAFVLGAVLGNRTGLTRLQGALGGFAIGFAADTVIFQPKTVRQLCEGLSLVGPQAPAGPARGAAGPCWPGTRGAAGPCWPGFALKQVPPWPLFHRWTVSVSSVPRRNGAHQHLPQPVCAGGLVQVGSHCMSRTTDYVLGALGVIAGAAVAGFGSGIGSSYGYHLMQSGQIPLPGAPRRGRRKPKGCEVKTTDFLIDTSLGPPDGSYRIQAVCDGQEVGEAMIEVYPEAEAEKSSVGMIPRHAHDPQAGYRAQDEPADSWTPRCQRNLAAQRKQHKLRTPSVARTAWIGLHHPYRGTGLGTAMYREALAVAHNQGIPMAPDACFHQGSTSAPAWRVWNRKLAWEGRTNRRRRKLKRQ